MDGFREFVEVRYTDLLRLGYLLTGSSHAAEDLVQDALVKLMRRWSKVADPMAYARRTMINQRTNLWRRLWTRESATGHLPEVAAGDPAERVADQQAVYAALRELPARMRAVVALRYVADLSEAEVAATLECSVGNVKSLASRGCARLRDALSQLDEATIGTGGQR